MTVRLSPRVVHTNIPITIAMFVIPESGEERTEDEERKKGKKKKERKKGNPTDTGSLIIPRFRLSYRATVRHYSRFNIGGPFILAARLASKYD